jgi:sterol desaturase/sphingolipid hydroxylase (fatty acid hydroxylase superfamily)
VVIPNALHDPVTYAIPFFIAFMALEIVSLRAFAEVEPERFRGVEYRDSRSSIVAGLGSLVVSGGARIFALVGYAALYAITPLRLDTHRWYTWVGVLLAVDLLWYLYHRCSHRVRIMWAGHQAHHNSEYFNLTTAVRQKWNPWFELLFWVPLPLLGVPPWLIFFAFSINLIFQFFVHTERVGRLPAAIEFVFNTPSHHRVHHASDKDYLDKNYAGILIVWDRMFGTYAEETHRPTYGLTKNYDTSNPFRLQYHEYAELWRDLRRAQGMHDKLGVVFGPPGRPAQAPVDGSAQSPVDRSVEREVVAVAPVENGRPGTVA